MSLPKNIPEVEKCQANVGYRAHLSRLRLLAYPGCLAISRSMRRAGGVSRTQKRFAFQIQFRAFALGPASSEIGHSPHTVAPLFGYPPYGRAAHRQCVKILTVRQDIDGKAKGRRRYAEVEAKVSLAWRTRHRAASAYLTMRTWAYVQHAGHTRCSDTVAAYRNL